MATLGFSTTATTTTHSHHHCQVSVSRRAIIVNAQRFSSSLQGMKSNTDDDNHHHSPSTSLLSLQSRRQTFIQSAAALALALLVGPATPTSASAADGDDTSTSSFPTSMAACRKPETPKNGASQTGVTNCVSTSSIKQLDLYAAPWTFLDASPEEAAARIKGVVASDPNLELLASGTTTTGSYYLKVASSRGGGLIKDTLEFIVNAKDKVVTFRGEQEYDADNPPALSDFGAIRKTLDSIRVRGQVFGVMGQSLDSADSYGSNNGPGGQLKAFFGLQSGKGFEDVFEEDE